jgi:hypothetical protein
MTKKGPLGKAEKFYVEQNADSMTVQKIAVELDRAISLIQDHVDHYLSMRTKAGGQFARQNGVVVMTQGASEMGDAFKDNDVVTQINKRKKNTVTTIKRDKSDSKE